MRGYIWVLVLGLLAPAAMAADDIAVSPQKSAGEVAYYPKLVKFPDPQIRDRVNKLLAGYGLKQGQDRRDCFKQLQDQGQKKDADSFYTSIETTYVSRRFLSVSVNQNTDCGGPYPSSAASPITLDLTRGVEVDWNKSFKPGFLATSDHPGKLAELYRARYAKLRKGDKDCLGAIHDDDFLDAVLWLDRKQGGLMVNPQLPHVAQACDEDIAFGVNELAPYIADSNLLADLQDLGPNKRQKN